MNVSLLIILLSLCAVWAKPRGGCRDNAPHWVCHDLKLQEGCTNEYIEKFMSKECKETCGICEANASEETFSVTDECDDVSPLCGDLKDLGHCSNPDFKGFMIRECRKTCDFCHLDDDAAKEFSAGCEDFKTVCPNLKKFGYCERPSFRKYVEDNCKQSCGFCPKSECGDLKGDFCQFIKKFGHCETPGFNKFNKVNCKQTCGHCEEECKDLKTVCSTMFKYNYCTNEKFLAYTKENCQKSCSFCKSDKDEDEDMPPEEEGDATPPPPGDEGPDDEDDTPRGGTCGKDKKKRGRIVGGVNARPYRWEWQGGLYYTNSYTGSKSFTCGGSLIAPNLFLTAAHCVDHRMDPAEMMIKFGDHDRAKVEGKEQDMQVEAIVYHDGWSRSTLKNDIALVKLKKNVKYDKYTGPICMPESGSDPAEDSTCYITGWGKLGVFKGTASVLQEAKLPIVPTDHCGKINKDISGKSRITNDMLCGGYKDDPNSIVSGCMGDSGGPYICKSGDSWFQQGVVSWGSRRCDAQHRFTVFTKLSSYIDWINAQKKKWNIA